MGFLEKLSNRVRSTDTSKISHTVDIEEKTLPNELPEAKNTDESKFNISTAISSLTHFWNQRNTVIPKDSLHSESTEPVDLPRNEKAEQLQDHHSFFDKMKESLIKGTNSLKNSISNQTDTPEKVTSIEINDSTCIVDEPIIEPEPETSQSILSDTTSYESLKNFFGKSISKIRETVNNIDNLANSSDSDNIGNNDNEKSDSVSREVETPVNSKNDKQKPSVSEIKETLPNEVENDSHATDEPQANDNNKPENLGNLTELSYGYVTSLFNKGISKIKETVNNIDKLADSTDSSDESINDNEPDTATVTIEEQNTTIPISTNKAPLADTEEITKDSIKEKIAPITKEASLADSEKQTIEIQPKTDNDQIKGFFHQSLNKIKKTSQSINLSNTMKGLLNKGSDKINPLDSSDNLDLDLNKPEITFKKEIQPINDESIDINNPMKGLLDKGSDKINLLGSSDTLDIDIDLNESETVLKKENLEQLIAESVTETQKLTQTIDTNKKENNQNIVFNEDPAIKDENTASKEIVKSTILSSPNDSISVPAVHDMAQKMAASVTNKTEKNFKSFEPKNIINKNEETIQNLAKILSDSSRTPKQLNSTDKSITDIENTLNGNEETIASLPIESNQNSTDTLTDSHLRSGHSINLKEPTLPTTRQLEQAIQKDNRADQKVLSNIQSNSSENDTNEPVKMAIHSGNIDTHKTENTEIESQSTQDPTNIKEKTDKPSSMPLIESSILKADQLDSIAEYKVNPPAIEDENSDPKAFEKHLDTLHENKSRGLFWGLAIFLLTMLLAGLWWLAVSDNNQPSRDTDFVSFESLAKEEESLNQINQTDALPIDTTEITQLDTTPAEKKIIAITSENSSNLPDQPNVEKSSAINSSQNDKPDDLTSKNNTLINQSGIEANRKTDKTNKIDQDQTLITTTSDIGNTEAQDSIINNPITNITTFLNNKDGALPKGFILHGLTFETASSHISKNSAQIISDLATLLKAHPSIKIRLEGHTDNQGKAQKNQRLSASRAQSVKSRLVNLEIDPARIKIAGLGEEFPIMDNETKIGQQNNRRVEVIIVDGWFLK